jgi:chromosome segregation ATPase
MRNFLGGRSGQGDSGGDTDLLTVETAAQMIDSLPSDVPRESQLRIVREAFAAGGTDISNLQRHTRTREAELRSEIELVRNRQEELRERSEEVVCALEEEIRKIQEEIRIVQESMEAGLAEEEEQVSAPMAALEGVERVRAFFAFPETDDAPPELGDVPETDGEENSTPLNNEWKGFRQVRAW